MSTIDQNQVSQTLQKISEALADDKLWLAREHYSSLTRICGYDQSIYKEYADLLLLMREDLAAGKFYFLSGERSGEAQRCIELFMKRYKRRKLGSIVSQFPKAAQKMAVEDYPDPIRSELSSWHFSGSIKSTRQDTDGCQIPSFIVGSIVVLFVVSIPIGIFTMIKWLISLLN